MTYMLGIPSNRSDWSPRAATRSYLFLDRDSAPHSLLVEHLTDGWIVMLVDWRSDDGFWIRYLETGVAPEQVGTVAEQVMVTSETLNPG